MNNERSAGMIVSDAWRVWCLMNALWGFILIVFALSLDYPRILGCTWLATALREPPNIYTLVPR